MNNVFVTEQRLVSSLIPNARNPRKISVVEQRKLHERISKFGFISIPCITQDNEILSGRQRIMDLMQSGFGELMIDVRVAVRALTDQEKKEILLIENSHAGEWDMELLAQDFNEILKADSFNTGYEDYLKGIAIELDDVVLEPEPELPIVAKMSEHYSSFVIVCTNEIDENHIAEKLGVDKMKCYKSSKIGNTHVVSAKNFIESW